MRYFPGQGKTFWHDRVHHFTRPIFTFCWFLEGKTKIMFPRKNRYEQPKWTSCSFYLADCSRKRLPYLILSEEKEEGWYNKWTRLLFFRVTKFRFGGFVSLATSPTTFQHAPLGNIIKNLNTKEYKPRFLEMAGAFLFPFFLINDNKRWEREMIISFNHLCLGFFFLQLNSEMGSGIYGRDLI